MSVKQDVINLQINVNSNQAQNQLNELRKRSDAIRDSMVGLKKSTQEYKDKAMELKTVNAQMDELKRTIGLTALSQKELERELTKLQRMKGNVVPMTKEFKDLADQIAKVENRLYEVKNNVTGFSKVFSKIKDEVKQFGAVAVAYLGFQFVSEQFTNIIRGAGKTSDQLADLRRVSGLTADGVTDLNKSLAQLDTRTSTGSLRDIAIIAGKLGVAKDDILDFTAATDELVVSLGDELGNADAITTSLGKILNVFDGSVNGDNITRLGNSFVVLANKGVASGGFIADFTQRVAAVSKAANISLGSVVGFAAGFEEMGLKVESSSTAFQKVIADMANDLPKAAKLAGAQTKQEIAAFINLFNNAPEQALIKFAEGLSKNKVGFAEITAGMKDAGEEGTRIITLLTTLGQSSEFFRQKLEDGNSSLKETTAINAAFALKNETLGASIDKLGKEFNRLVASSAVTGFLSGAVNGVTAFIQSLKNASQFVSENSVAIKLLLAGIILLNFAYIKSAAAIIAETTGKILNAIATRAIAVATNIAIASQAAYITIVTLATGRINLATAATRLWSIAIKTGLGPIGILITVIGVAVVALNSMSSSYKVAGDRAKFHAETLKEATAEMSKQKSEIHTLTAVLKDLSISERTREDSLNRLIAMNPEYLHGLTMQNVTTLEGKRILDLYNTSLETNANLKAAQLIKDREFDKDVRLRATRQELEIAQKAGTRFGDLSKEAQEAFGSARTAAFDFTADLFNFEIPKRKFDAAFEQIDKQILVSSQNSNAATDNLVAKEKEKEDARRQFLLREITITRQAQNALKNGTAEYELATKKYAAAVEKYYAEFGNRKKKLITSDGSGIITGDDKKNREKEAVAEKKRLQKEQDDLLKDAEKFRKELDKLKRRSENGTIADRERELEQIDQQYADLTARAVSYWAKTTAEGKKAAADIEAIRKLQIETLMKKFFSEDAAKEYENSLQQSEKYFDDLRRSQATQYSQGTISKTQYEQALTDIELREADNRAVIAQDYSGTVKKAAADVTGFVSKQGDLRVAKAISDSEKIKAATQAEVLAGLRLNVITAPKGSLKELDAKKQLLKKQFELDTEYLDKKSNAYKEKEAQLNKELEDLAAASFQSKVDRMLQVIDYFSQAMQAINTILANRENRELQRDKKANDTKRNAYKSQLDGKLISQERYDKKMGELQKAEDEKIKAIRLKQAKREKALAVFNAIINTAAGIAKAIPNLALMALAGIVGGLQVAAIASQPLPELGRGGYLANGPKHRDSQKGLHVVNPLTGKTEMLLEREEAVVSAPALKSNKTMTITGTGRQIVSAVNSAHGGVSFATGAQVKWHTAALPRFKPSFVRMMATGGMVNGKADNATSAAANDYTDLFITLINEQRQTREDMANWQTNLNATVSFQELKQKNDLYERAKATGRVGK
jgi:TP901 family phage tail tape measure protein